MLRENSSSAFSSNAFGLAEVVDLHRVVDDEFDRLQRVDLVRVAAEPRNAVAHRREVDDARNAREVLEQHAGRSEGNLLLRGALHIPSSERFDVRLLDEPSVFVPEQIFQQDFQGKREARDLRKTVLLERAEAEVLHAACANLEGGAGAEAVHGRHR